MKVMDNIVDEIKNGSFGWPSHHRPRLVDRLRTSNLQGLFALLSNTAFTLPDLCSHTPVLPERAPASRTRLVAWRWLP